MMSDSLVFVGILALAVLIDLVVGEPPSFMHPVVGMGRFASWYDSRYFARRIDPGYEFFIGLGLVTALVAIVFLSSRLILFIASFWPLVSFLVSALLLKSSLAIKELAAAAIKVEKPLRADDLPGARSALRSLCSRETANLTTEDVAVATVASLAENLCDSIIAPLFYYALFGITGALCYRAINTLDAMVGYRGKYEYFGKAAARLDDLLNFIPARLSAGAIILAGIIRRSCLGPDAATRAVMIVKRDHARTPSINGGWPMAAAAGLLGIVIYKKESYALGDSLEPCTVDTIALMRMLLWFATAVALGFVVLSTVLR